MAVVAVVEIWIVVTVRPWRKRVVIPHQLRVVKDLFLLFCSSKFWPIASGVCFLFELRFFQQHLWYRSPWLWRWGWGVRCLQCGVKEGNKNKRKVIKRVSNGRHFFNSILMSRSLKKDKKWMEVSEPVPCLDEVSWAKRPGTALVRRRGFHPTFWNFWNCYWKKKGGYAFGHQPFKQGREEQGREKDAIVWYDLPR